MIQRSAEHTVNRLLPPCKVDVQLLRELENYITVEIPNLIGCATAALVDVLCITFEEDNGKSTLPSMALHQSQYLPDEITQAEVSLNEHNVGLSIRIVFSNGKLGGRLEVTSKGPHCRENAQAISVGLYRIVNSRRNLRYFSRRNEPVWLEVVRLVLVGLGAILASSVLVLALDNKPEISAMVRLGALAVSLIVIGVLPGILPPFQFDHAGAKNRDLVTLWTLGAVGATLVGIVIQWVVAIQ